MSKLLKKAFGGVRANQQAASGSLSGRITGVGHRVNNATGDVGPDAPGRPGGPGGPGDRPGRPRGRNRRLGGDVRTPLAF